MALVRSFERLPMKRNSLHKEIKGFYAVIETDGKIVVQINTSGSDVRQNPGKLSQTIQLDEVGARNLVDILRKEFGI